MADQIQGRARKSFMKELSSAVAKKALAPFAAAAATAGTRYLLRHAEKIWEERVLPKLHEHGGGQAALSALAEQVTEKARPVAQAVGDKLPDVGGSDTASDGDREQERKARQKRRQQRRRALEQSGST